MKLQKIILAAFTVALPSLMQAQDNCRSVEQTKPRTSIWESVKDIEQAGEYCLLHDTKAPKVHGLWGERSYAGYMLTVTASDVVFDLHGFTLNAEAHGMGGISSGYKSDTSVQRHITIRNGVIRTRGQSAILFADMFGARMMSSLLSDFKATYESPGPTERNFQKMQNALPRNAAGYPITGHVVEGLKLEAQVGRAVIGMQGAGNIIRNSTIIAEDEHSAIYLFGPNSIIENNIIIYKGHKGKGPSAAPIKLHQADGTVIRNNDIIVEMIGDEAPQAAISLIDSKNVIAEGNRIYGIKTLMHAWDDTSNLIDRDNDFRSMLRRPWLGGKSGVQ
jgi:hypothetical protein